MPSKPSKITSLSAPDAVHIINKLFEDISNRLSNTQQLATSANQRIAGQPTLTFGAINANSSVSVTTRVNGATTHLVASANPLLTLGNDHLTWIAFISGTNQVTVRVTNPTTGPITVNTVRWNILVS